MRVSGYFVSLLLLAVALPLAAQVNDTYVIPVAGSTPGAFGTHWQTELSVFNPQSYSLKVSITYIPTGGGQGMEALFTVPANAVAFFNDALNDVFQRGGTGALLLGTFPEDNPGVPNNVVDRAFLVSTETFNNAKSGTFGQTIPGTWVGLQDDGVTAIAHGIRNIAAQGWRTNIGAVNLGRTSVTMLVSVYDYNGHTILNKAPFNIPPFAHIQDGLPVEVDRGSIEFFLQDPSSDKSAVVFPYTSTIDQYSGDPSYQTPALLATAKVLFPKTGMAADPAAVGKKITIDDARRVRANATRIGEVAVSLKAGR